MTQLTPASRYVLIATVTAFVVVVGSYLARGVINDELSSLDSKAWLQFASFAGNLLAPIAGLGAAIIVALQLGFTGRVTQLEMLEQQCIRLDKETQRSLQQPLKNSHYEVYLGMSLIEVVYALSNENKVAPDDLGDALNALLQNFAVALEVVARKRLLAERLEKSLGDYPWVEYSEHAYWVSRYSAILGRLCKVIGHQKVANKLTKRQIEVCAEISSEFKTIK